MYRQPTSTFSYHYNVLLSRYVSWTPFCIIPFYCLIQLYVSCIQLKALFDLYVFMYINIIGLSRYPYQCIFTMFEKTQFSHINSDPGRSSTQYSLAARTPVYNPDVFV